MSLHAETYENIRRHRSSGSIRIHRHGVFLYLFGPLFVAEGQHIDLCSSYLSEGTLKATVHFRNLTTAEVTKGQDITLPSGGGACVTYQGKGYVVGLTRGDGAGTDWVSPSNALIATMSVIDDFTPAGGAYRSAVRATVLGVPKIWVKGL